LVIAWALGAIAVRQSEMPLIAVSTAGLAIALIILVAVLAFALPSRRHAEAAPEKATESQPPG
jgi:cbb3-type cytochrome oxidase subunit 3